MADERQDSEDNVPSEGGAHSNSSIAASLDQDEINIQSVVYKTGSKAMLSSSDNVSDCCSTDNKHSEDKGDGREKDCDHIFMDDSNTYADLDAGDTYYAVPEDVACGDKKQPSCTLGPKLAALGTRAKLDAPKQQSDNDSTYEDVSYYSAYSGLPLTSDERGKFTPTLISHNISSFIRRLVSKRLALSKMQKCIMAMIFSVLLLLSGGAIVLMTTVFFKKNGGDVAAANAAGDSAVQRLPPKGSRLSFSSTTTTTTTASRIDINGTLNSNGTGSGNYTDFDHYSAMAAMGLVPGCVVS